MFSLLQVVDGVVADPAVVEVFLEVELMAENNRIRVFEREFYVFCFNGAGAYDGHEKK